MKSNIIDRISGYTFGFEDISIGSTHCVCCSEGPKSNSCRIFLEGIKDHEIYHYHFQCWMRVVSKAEYNERWGSTLVALNKFLKDHDLRYLLLEE